MSGVCPQHVDYDLAYRADHRDHRRRGAVRHLRRQRRDDRLGALQEKYETPGSGNFLPFILGSMVGAVPWIVILIYFFAPGSTSTVQPPAFVYGIIISLFVFFNTFAISQTLQYRQVGPWRDYLFGERVYITLSLMAKTALAWQVFAGAIIPAVRGRLAQGTDVRLRRLPSR